MNPQVVMKKGRFRIEKLEERIAPTGAMVFDTVTGHIVITPSENIHIINNGGGSRYRLMDPVTNEVTDIEVEVDGLDPV